MDADDLEVFLELVLGEKMALEITAQASGDACTAVEILSRRAATLAAPFRERQDSTRFGRVRKDVRLLQLTAKLLEEVVYEFDEAHDVELVRSA